MLALVLLAGCPPGGGDECTIDDHCSGGQVCARDNSCSAPSDVREVQTTWTVRGQPASSTTCAAQPDLFISFIGDDFADTLAYSPVPCSIGQFTIDKLPSRFRQVELGREGGSSSTLAIPASAVVMFDLP